MSTTGGLSDLIHNDDGRQLKHNFTFHKCTHTATTYFFLLSCG